MKDSHQYSLEDFDDEAPSKRTGKLLDAIDAVRNGEKNSEERLYELVENGTLSVESYNELIEKGRVLRVKKKIEQEKKFNALKLKISCIVAFVVLFGSMLITLGQVIAEYGEGSALWYFLLWAWAFSRVGEEDNRIIKSLEHENERLKESLNTSKAINKELESKLQKARADQQQD